MAERLISLLVIMLCMIFVIHLDLTQKIDHVSPTLLLGFLLIAAYCSGYILAKFGLPRITGYIAAGLVLGPYCLNFFSQVDVLKLSFLNNLALAFIAFCAGGELIIENIRRKLKTILFMVIGMTSVTFLGVSSVVLTISDYIPFMSGYDFISRFAIAALFGVIAVARSPSSAIAIISETKAKGDYTNTVLSVTIAMDVVIIILFGIVISFCQMILKDGGSANLTFVIKLLLEILIALVFGLLLGKATIFLLVKTKVEFPVVIIAVGFLVIKFSHLLGDYLQDMHDISINLEPLLICMTAGFTVQNFSGYGKTFIHKMDRVSFPIYVAFFAITGASINVEILKTGWFLGLVVMLTRLFMVFIGSYLSGKFSGDKPVNYHHTWLGFITQAGVSLGLLTEIVRRFPEIGIPIQSILIASITINQVIGPVAFKFALQKVGDAKIMSG